MVLVLGRSPEGTTARRHDVGSLEVDAMARPHRAREHGIIGGETVVLEGDRAERAFEELPGFNLVEQLEQQDTKEQLARRVGQVVAIDDMSDEILADPVRRAVGIGEFVDRQHRSLRPGSRLAPHAPEEHRLPLGGESPIAFVDLRYLRRREVAQHDRRGHRRGRNGPNGDGRIPSAGMAFAPGRDFGGRPLPRRFPVGAFG